MLISYRLGESKQLGAGKGDGGITVVSEQSKEDLQLESGTTVTVQKDEDVLRLEAKNRTIIANLKQLEQEERVIWGAKTKLLRQLAENYESLHEKGAYQKPISTICSTICNQLAQLGLWSSYGLAHKQLDQRYKQMEYNDYKNQVDDQTLNEQIADISESFVSTSGTTTEDQFNFYYSNPANQGEMFPSYDEPNRHVQIDFLLNKQQTKPLDQMSRDEKRQTTEQLLDMLKQTTEQQREIRRRAREMAEVCENEKIPLSPEYEKEDDDHIGTVYGETGISVAWEAIERYMKMLSKVQNKLYYFKPPLKMARKMADALDEEIEFWRPMCDEKFRKDSMSWWCVQLDNIWFGKHAAAQMNASILPDKTKRALTREQVGDKAEECYERALRFAAAQRWRVEFQTWYISEIEPRIGVRAKELHGVLSEKSFT